MEYLRRLRACCGKCSVDQRIPFKLQPVEPEFLAELKAPMEDFSRVNLIRFVVLLPHYRSCDGTLGSSLFQNWSYSRWHAFFASKKSKDRFSLEYHVDWAIRIWSE